MKIIIFILIFAIGIIGPPIVLYKPHGGVPLYLKPLLRAVKDNYLFKFVAVQDAYYGNGGN